jgi:predicted ATPase/DNA-binding winged helix-turn-helix (wHTH) protein
VAAFSRLRAQKACYKLQKTVKPGAGCRIKQSGFRGGLNEPFPTDFDGLAAMPGGDRIGASGFVSFGPFRLTAAERLLVRDDTPVEIGGRALDLLIALTDRAGQVLSRRELMDLVWPGLTVEEASLRVHITALRRVLGDGRDGTRYIVNVSGRGYSFVAPVQRPLTHDGAAIGSPTNFAQRQNLPAPLQLLIGREQTITTLSSQLLSRRFISVVGPGGIGKTTIATAVAHALYQNFGDDGVCFVDLSSLTDPAVVPDAVASAVGCIVAGTDPERSLLAFLAGRRTLMVLDSCEHVITTVAPLAERLFRGVPSVYLLTTSREALRVEGESVHLLSPLDGPLDDMPSAAQAIASPAVQLFMERAAASGYEAELSDSDAPVVATLCRRLDGIALAIELAASRVGTYGIQGTADLLDHGAALILQGRRSAQPRHQTLKAMLDWSFTLLSAYEQSLLCKLSVFVGPFSREAAEAVAGEADSEAQAVSNAMIGLVDKSLIAILPISGPAYFRLLDTTRDYAAAKLSESGDVEAVTGRLTRHFAAFLKSSIESSVFDHSNAVALAPHMGNIRKAVAWSFFGSCDPSIGVELAVYAAPLFIELSLYDECQKWCRQALAALGDKDRGTSLELKLQEALAISSIWTRGTGEQVRTEIEHGLALSETLRDGWRQIHFLAGLNILLTRLGDFSGALTAAQRSAAVAGSTAGAAATVMAEWMLGASHHFAGDQVAALRHCKRGFELEPDAAPMPENLFGFYHRERARVVLARSLWLRGLSDQAQKAADQIIGAPAESRQPVMHCVALLYSIPVLLWNGRFEEAAEPIELAIAKALKYSLTSDHALGLALKGALMVANGDASSGVEILREALKVLQAQRHRIVTPTISCALAEGLARCGQPEESLAMIDEGFAHAEEVKEIFWLPDLLRVRGETLLTLSRPDPAAAEDSLQRSIDYARKQFALSWELRAAIPLARIWGGSGRSNHARAMLDDIYQQFTEGFETRDLVAARQLIDELSEASRFSTR